MMRMIMTAPSEVIIDYLLNKEEANDTGNDDSINGHLGGIMGVPTFLPAASMIVVVVVVIMAVCTAASVGLSEMGECVEEYVS